MTSTQLTVGLLWHSFSSDNLGVGALSESQIAIAAAAARAAGVRLRFIVFGTEGARNYVPKDQVIEFAAPLSAKELFTGRSRFARDVKRCDLVLDIGEGDSFTDIYGIQRFRRQMLSKFIVLWCRRPLVLSPQTIGPFERPFARWIAVQAMKRCQRVFARDNLSSDYVRSLGLSANCEEAIDVAFRLPFTRPTPTGHSRRQVGLNVSGLLFSGGYAGENQFGLTLDYPSLVRRLLTKWCADDSIDVWLVPHVLSDRMPRDDDRKAISALLTEFPAAKAAPEFASPSEAKSFIAGLDFLTGARMHACIAALSAGVAVVPLAYSRKFNGLFSSLGYAWLADGKALTTDEAFERIDSGLSQWEALAASARACATEVERRLSGYQGFLEQRFRALSQ